MSAYLPDGAGDRRVVSPNAIKDAPLPRILLQMLFEERQQCRGIDPQIAIVVFRLDQIERRAEPGVYLVAVGSADPAGQQHRVRPHRQVDSAGRKSSRRATKVE